MNTVLLVDGDAFSRNVFARALTKEGYHVLQADSWPATEAALAETDVHIVSLDGSSQEDGGTEWVHRFRRQGHTQPVVLLRSVFLGESEVEPASIGVSRILHKPLAPSELSAHLSQILDAQTLSPTDTVELLRIKTHSFAAAIDKEIFGLENSIRELQDTGRGSERATFEATRLVETSRQHGFVRVSQALGRVEQALLKIDERSDRLNQQLWAELNDALDDAYVAARRHVMELKRESPDRDRAIRTNVRILLLDEDSDIAPHLEAYGAKHLFEVDTVHTAEDLFERIHEPGIHGVFVDIDGHLSSGQALTTIQMLRQRSRTQTFPPVGVISNVSNLKHRLKAAQVEAVRYLEKPIDGTEFADAVQFMAALSEPENRSIIVLRSEECRCDLETTLSEAGFEITLLFDINRIVDELERSDPGAVMIHAGVTGAQATNIIRLLRATPRWSDFPIIFHAAEDGDDALEAVLAGADEVFYPGLSAQEAAARLTLRIRRTKLLTQRADRDLLTGLLMRRAFLERVSVRLSEARRQGSPLVLCLLDLDRFKLVNDTYGHLAGDRVLMELGRQLKEHYRMEDLRGRWGGEEFAIALVNEETETAKFALQRVLEAFGRTAFEDDDGEVFHCTFSAGIAEFPKDGERFEALLRKADERLFAAKVAGRNRIT